MTERKYAVQRRYQTDLAKRVGGALDKMFEHINGNSLHINETVDIIVAPKPLTKKQRTKLCTYLLKSAKQDGDKETIRFECVPYEESIEARATQS